MNRYASQIWDFINDTVDNKSYLPDLEEIENHFDLEAAPCEVYEMIPTVLDDYVSQHKLEGVMIA